jgi:ribbon-helix-helix CopG family protein
MAITTIRTTYALDAGTVKTLENMAQRWGVSKSEALRRAIRAAAKQPSSQGMEALEALTKLQQSVALSAGRARVWQGQSRRERQESARRLERRRS